MCWTSVLKSIWYGVLFISTMLVRLLRQFVDIKETGKDPTPIFYSSEFDNWDIIYKFNSNLYKCNNKFQCIFHNSKR